MASLTRNKSIKELFGLLSVYIQPLWSHVSQADKDATLLAILKKQQETIEQNQETIEQNQETIEQNQETIKENQETIKENQETIKEQKKCIEYLMARTEENYDGEMFQHQEETNLVYNDNTSYLQGDSSKYIDYSNFKLCDDYCGERRGFTYLHGIHGPGYYALKK
jgi:hypothetical protein